MKIVLANDHINLSDTYKSPDTSWQVVHIDDQYMPSECKHVLMQVMYLVQPLQSKDSSHLTPSSSFAKRCDASGKNHLILVQVCSEKASFGLRDGAGAVPRKPDDQEWLTEQIETFREKIEAQKPPKVESG